MNFIGNEILDIELQNKFDIAWLKHIHRNPHHWQHWILRENNGATKILKMPEEDILEMVCDWEGGSKAKYDRRMTAKEWYESQRSKMLLNEETIKEVEKLLGIEK